MKTMAIALALGAGHVSGVLGHDVSLAATSEISQRFVCERSYTNFAWGYQHSGIFVDREGRVYRFSDRTDVLRRPPQRPDLTEAEMDQNYGAERQLVRTVSSDELLAMYRLIPAAAKGHHSKRVSAGADRGASVSACYVFDAAEKRYRKVELAVAGDWEYRNLAPEAQELAVWLASLARPTQDRK
jgi:hypothetical protein